MTSNSNMRPEWKRPIESNPELIDNFNRRFSVITANTHALKEQAYRLRYQVYCIEKGFINQSDCSLEQEVDEFDDRSAHSIIIDRNSQTVIATVRIILPDPKAMEKSFPIQRVCSHPLLHSQRFLHTTRSAEISRFAISKKYSRRASDRSQPRQHAYSHIERRAPIPNITLGLISGILRMSIEHGITELFAVMEPSLMRLLARFSIYFSPIGPMVDYYGMCQPCHAIIKKLSDRVHKERIDVWEIITNNGRLIGREDPLFSAFSHYPPAG